MASVKLNPSSSFQQFDVDKDFGKIICPARIYISGPTMSGKSLFAEKLIEYRSTVFNVNFERIIFALPDDSLHLHQEFVKRLYEICSFIEIVEGLPDISDLNIKDNKKPKLLVIDDMMSTVFESQTILDLFTKDSHHCNCTVVVTSQNFFHPSKFGKTFVRNCSEKVIFFDKTDAKQLSILSMQIFPNKPNFLKHCFDWLFENKKDDKLKYLLIDSSPLSLLPHNAIVRSCIFPEKSEGNKVTPVFFFPNSE